MNADGPGPEQRIGHVLDRAVQVGVAEGPSFP